ncbi:MULTISPECIES: ABC transporter substrate-binding protein [unclassified Bradyrhizobium]|uniref:ABC transporter substrate-binding protein n=1 Tax=Bradyrhizobium sp. USDA 4541 TaxID=2817704 RepID=UPI0020A5E617|nr:ABC transporter substrate-binding protein [Bradyrhizobium sp. USDA 4541]MCP1848139.1 branched-chain amino acid transport system substrate-binding protein [Bradyrhizobium sp. USDA 4541]
MQRYLQVASFIAALGISIAHAETVKIGLLGGQTGGLASLDQPLLHGAELAVEEINATGGVDGKQLELIARDTRSDTGETAVMANEMVGLQVNFLVTPCDADTTIAAGQAGQAAGIVTISGCASPPILPGNVGDYLFLNATPDNIQGTALAEYAEKQGYKTALTLVSPDSPYTEKLPQYFASVFRKDGGNVLPTVSYKMGQQDFSVEVSKIRDISPKPDVIVTSAFEPDFPAFIKQLRAAGVDIPVLSADAIDTATTFALGGAAEGVVFSTHGFPEAGNRLSQFNKRYQAKFGSAPESIFAALGYDLIEVIAATVKGAGGHLDGGALLASLNNIENLKITTGSITYKGMNRVPNRQVALVRVVDGKPQHVEDIIPDASKIPAP